MRFVKRDHEAGRQVDPRIKYRASAPGGGPARFAGTPVGSVPVTAKVCDRDAWVGLPDVSPGAAIRKPGTDEWIVTGRVAVDKLQHVHDQDCVITLKVAQALKPSLADTISDFTPETMGDVDVANQTGKGVVVGIVDYGADFRHKHFRNADGTSRLMAVWNQWGDRDGSATYGRVHSREAINTALQAADPYDALGYKPHREGSHGTHVMDIAAGNGSARASRGVAPGADLVFVESRSPFPGDAASIMNGDFGDSASLIEAVDFIFRQAGARPCVVNLSLGTNGGPHDGSNPVEEALDALVKAAPNRAITIAASNTYTDGIHKTGTVSRGGEATLHWDVEAHDRSHNEVEIWYAGADEFGFELIDPDGGSTGPIALGEEGQLESDDGNVLAYINHRAGDRANGDNVIHILQDQAMVPLDGRWSIRLTGIKADNGNFHAWIERDDYQDHVPSSFARDDPSHTLGSISCGRESIVVSSYDAHRESRPISYFSSAGPTRDGRQKPEVSAPGHAVRAAKSAVRADSSDRGTVVMSGTSMAAPAVAGLIALMFAKALQLGLSMPIEVTRDVLMSTAAAVGEPGSWDSRFGFGRVSMAALMHPFFRSAALATYSSSHRIVPKSPMAAIRDRSVTTIPVPIADEEPLERLGVKIDLKHTWRGDLRVSLLAPSRNPTPSRPHSPEVVLHDRAGGDADDLRETYTSETHPGLQNLLGRLPRGVWQLRVQDAEHDDEGQVNSVELNFN